MAAQTTVVLKDKDNLNVNYVPFVQSGNASVAFWADKTAGTLSGYRLASLSVTLPQDRVSGMSRIVTRLTYPVLDAVTGAVKHTMLFSAEYKMHASATADERKQMAFRAASLLEASVIKTDAVQNLEGAS